MNPTVIGIIGLVLLVLIFLSRLPIALTMVLLGFVGFSLLVSLEGALNLLAQGVMDTFSSYTMSVIPLFLFMGTIAYHAGISEKLFRTAYKLFGSLPGGMAIATIGACAGFGAVCGSLTASVAIMATLTLPEMERYGYDKALATGSVAAGGPLAVLIPPSVIFILYGIQTEQPIGKLFIAGILPGILLTGLFSLTVYIMCKRNPELGPAGPRIPFKEKIQSVREAADMLILFVLVIGGLFIGLFTPTEGGAVGALGAILVALLRRRLTWKGFRDSLFETIRFSCMVFLLLYGTTIFGQFLAVTRIPFDLGEWLIALPLPKVLVLAGILFIYFLGGCFMGGLAFLILTVPIFYPIAISLGFDPILFGVLMVVMVEIGSITPPVGVSVYIISGISGVPLEVAFKGIFVFLIPYIIFIILLIAFPQISLFLPGLMR
jgi:tripartite ATP-independent transporter DctM subunit